MKKIGKRLLIGIGIIAVVIAVAVGYMFWKMGQPLYTFGSVRNWESIQYPLKPSKRSGKSSWPVEYNLILHYDVYGKGRPILIVHGGPGIPYANAWKGLQPLEGQYAFYYYHQRGAGDSMGRINSFASKNYQKMLHTLRKDLA